MPKQKRYKTNYPGIYYILGTSVSTGKTEKIYYIRYTKDNKKIEEKAGRQYQDDMTPARAARIRGQRIDGKDLPNNDRREKEEAYKSAEKNRWTIERLWEQYKNNKQNLKGIVTDENRFQNHILPYFGDKEPREIISLDIDRVRLKLLKTRKPGTVKNILELLRRIVNFGVNKNLCEGFGYKIELPKVNNLKTEDLTPNELERLWKAIQEDTNIQAANLMKMALFTGMRRSELFKLKWKNIDFRRNFIQLKDPKGGPDQKIPLNELSRQLLMNHPRSESPYAFPGRGGRRRVDITKQVNRIKNRAGLPKEFRALHGLRHVYASMLASSGKVDMFQLQKLLTHKSPQMVHRYAHLRDEALQRASAVVGEELKDVVGSKIKKVIR